MTSSDDNIDDAHVVGRTLNGAVSPREPVDVTAVIEGVNLLANSMRVMAERIRELEAHAEAYAKSSEELEAANRQLTIEIGEVVQDRETLAASIVAEGDRLKQLERHAALAIARATTLNRDLGAARDNLTTIIDAVENRLAADASASSSAR